MQNERPCPLLAADFKVDPCIVLLAAQGVTGPPIGPCNNEPQMSTSLSGIILVFNIDISCAN